jgi:hypothetical protein
MPLLREMDDTFPELQLPESRVLIIVTGARHSHAHHMLTKSSHSQAGRYVCAGRKMGWCPQEAS